MVKKHKTGIYHSLIEPTMKGVLIFVFIGSILFTLASFIWYRSNVMRLANEVYQLEKKSNSLVLVKEDLQAKVLQLENYSRILKIATEKIGLKPAVKRPFVLEINPKEFAKINGE